MPNERSHLLRESLSHGNLLHALADEEEPDAPSNAAWASALKRRSAVLSDLLSGNSHSGFAPLPFNEEEDGSGDGFSSDENDASARDVGSLRAEKRKGRGYDGEFRAQLAGEGGNGVRQWYDNYVTIDWIHDAIKYSLRMRKLRRRKQVEGIRGWLVNLWDGSQGWVLVTAVGFFTAAVAYLIIVSEALLFDYKEGYCSTNPTLPKRFCCPATHLDTTLSGVTFAVAPSSSLLRAAPECASWRTWGEVWTGTKGGGEGAVGDIFAVDYIAFVLIALILATLASTLTIYLSSSTSVYSSKDSAGAPFPGFSPNFPAHPPDPPSVYGATGSSISAAAPRPLPRPRKVMYFAAGSGIPEVKTILSGPFVIRGYLGSWTLFTKSVGLALSVASGLSLGKEGPFVHIASCIGNILSRFFPKYDRNEAKRREIISAACAAGVAVSFGAPVGGTLFSLEEVSYYFPPRVMVRSFWCAMIAAMTLKLLDPFGSGKIVLFQVTYDRDWATFELVGFVALGIFGGVYGALFCKANIWWTRNVRNGTILKTHPILEVTCITLVTVVISFFNPFTKMSGPELVLEFFSECHTEGSFTGLCVSTPELAWKLVYSIAFALVTKALLTVATFGIKLPAGIFIPTLAVGACAGRMAGLLVEIAHAKYPMLPIFDSCRKLSEDGPLPFGQACVLPGVWAMVGAAAALAGVTRTCVSLAVITFELTGTLSYTIPVMLGILIAKSVGDAIETRSIYDLVIELNDLPYLDVKQEYVHESTPLDIVDEDAPRISLDEDNTVRSLRDKLSQLYRDATGGGFPIVGEEAGGVRLFGYIAAKELEHGLASTAQSPPDTPCTFRTVDALRRGVVHPTSGLSTPAGNDFSWLVEMAPVTVHPRSPMELLHEMFSKLGVRYLILVDERGFYLGVVEKNRYLKYLAYTEKLKHTAKANSERAPNSSALSA